MNNKIYVATKTYFVLIEEVEEDAIEFKKDTITERKVFKTMEGADAFKKAPISNKLLARCKERFEGKTYYINPEVFAYTEILDYEDA